MKQLRWKDFSLVSKIVIEVGMIAVLLFAMNMLFYVRINNSMQKMDNVYASNAELTELSQVFEKVQDNMYKYLKVKSSQTLLDYYQNEAKYRNELEKLNEDNINDPVKLLERNIRKMSETYLDCTAETVAAKRGRNVEQYKRKYDDATKLYRYIQSSIDELNNLMFQENSSTYAVLRAVMRYLEISNSVIMIIIVAGGMLLLIQATRNMFGPLSNMAETAQLVGQGNFHVKMHDTDAQDELGTVTRAFNTMVENLDLYMARTKASMEKEQQMMERELLMENHLKEAQLKYLQSQINPHFLFNSLNAGAQLAMMEDAERTGIFVEKMADFFRYNVKKGQEDATLGEELEAVDNYIYILNVRFAGDIHFSKEVDESLENVRMPSMILQPVVENAVNHGIRDIEWEGKIHLTVTGDADYIRISVKDNGKGMTQEQIEGVLSGNREHRNEEGDSTGIGMNNVISRLELYYEESGLMEINSEGEGKGTEAVIYIPVHEN
jgi:two-component system sensor histidine kinase YesM